MSVKQQTPQQLANQIARQKKKIEKDKRRKQYEDIQIQGTNNSSIVSKRSVEMLYTTKLNPEMGEWFQYFVKNPKRRSPAINRGYWIRMESIKQLILRIIKQTDPNEDICIVNLGCGFDPLPFQLLSEFKITNPKILDRLTFVDIDYPDLVENKLKMINESDEILSVIGDVDSSARKDLGIVLSSKNYNLVGCNLRDSKLFNEQLSTINTKATTNIFIAEVSLAYMKPEHANPVIANASKYHNSHFIILEQLLPAGLQHPFAVKMMYHFDHLRSSLGCVQDYPLIKDQVKRFGEYYSVVEANDLLYNWHNLTTDDLKNKVSEIESFDEWEEFIVFCQHYVIVHATNNNINGNVYEKLEKKEEDKMQIESEPTLEVSFQTSATFERKFPASCYLNGKVFVHGGSGQTRENSLISFDVDFADIKPEAFTDCVKIDSHQTTGDVPSPRMCHTFTSINDREGLLIGGRGRPGQKFADVYKFNAIDNSWHKLGELEAPVSRHSTAVLNEEEVLIFGKEGFIRYNHKKNKSFGLKQIGENSINYESCAFYFDGSSGFIVGGMISNRVPEVNDRIWRFQFVEDDLIKVEEVAQDAEMSRIGASCALINKEILVVVGGVNSTKILGRDNCIMTYNLKEKTFKSIPIDEMLIGFNLLEKNGKILCLGGGGVCYSFGSYYNGVVCISTANV